MSTIKSILIDLIYSHKSFTLKDLRGRGGRAPVTRWYSTSYEPLYLNACQEKSFYFCTKKPAPLSGSGSVMGSPLMREARSPRLQGFRGYAPRSCRRQTAQSLCAVATWSSHRLWDSPWSRCKGSTESRLWTPHGEGYGTPALPSRHREQETLSRPQG